MQNQPKKKKAPPVPKFEPSQESKNQLLSKMGELYSKLGSSLTEQEPEIDNVISVVQTIQADPAKQAAVSKPIEPDKKKLNLSNINSKLASMMNSKKDLLKPKVEQKQSKKDEQKSESTILSSGRKINLDEQYDPSHPNNYDMVKVYYEDADPKPKAPAQPALPEPDMDIEVQQDANVGLSQTQQKALKMMQKYGYKVGDGLGKNKQGITTPLTIKKTTESSCIIMPSSIPMNYVVPREVSARTALESLQIPLSPVIVLNNIVTIDQLDQSHQLMIREELEKYGKVTDWMVYLLGRDLRIFIRFEAQENALRAFTDLNEKYYEGNLVSVRFYNEAAFGSFKLDEPLHPHISC